MSVFKNNFLNKTSGRFVLASALFFFTGFAGLVYEIAWHRKLVDIFGVSITSLTIIVTVFMAGLGIGGLIGGRFSRTSRNPIRLFGICEILCGIFGLFSIAILALIGRINLVGFRESFGEGGMLLLLGAVCFFFLMLPTLFMGMSLPLLVKGFIERDDYFQQTSGILYGINTLGASLGSLLAGFVLIEALGLKGATWTAAAINITVGILFLTVLKKSDSVEATEKKDRRFSFSWTDFDAVWIYGFFAGFLSLGYQIFIFRWLTVLMSGITYTFSFMLFVYLGLMGVGAYFSKKVMRISQMSRESLLNLVCVTFSTVILCLVFVFCVLSKDANVFILNKTYLLISRGMRISLLVNPLSSIVVFLISAFVLLPAFFFGGLFPLLASLEKFSGTEAGAKMGWVYFFNSIGCVAGSVLMGFIILPHFGSDLALFLMIFLAGGISIYAAYQNNSQAAIMPLIVLVLGLCAFSLGQGVYPKTTEIDLFGHSRVVDSSEGELGVATVVMTRGDTPDEHTVLNIEIDSMREVPSIYNSSTPLGFSKDKLLRHFVSAGFFSFKNIYVLGFGDGLNHALFLLRPELENLTVAELNRQVYEFTFKYNPFVRGLVSENPKIKMVAMDGKRYLSLTREKFDYINLGGGHSEFVGSGLVYSKEFLEVVKNHLTEKGVVVLTSHDTNLNYIRAMCDVFPYVVKWEDVTFVCSKSPISIDMLTLRSNWEKMPSYVQDQMPWEKVVETVHHSKFSNLNKTVWEAHPGIQPTTVNHPLVEYKFLSLNFKTRPLMISDLPDFDRFLSPLPIASLEGDKRKHEEVLRRSAP